MSSIVCILHCNLTAIQHVSNSFPLLDHERDGEDQYEPSTNRYHNLIVQMLLSHSWILADLVKDCVLGTACSMARQMRG
jgi:hypothetical protein